MSEGNAGKAPPIGFVEASAARDLPADSSLFTRNLCCPAACFGLLRAPPAALSSKALSLLLSLSIFMTTVAASAAAALPPRPFFGVTMSLPLEASLSPCAIASRLAGSKNFFMRSDGQIDNRAI